MPGIDDAHRTQVELTDVTIKGITPDKVHLKFLDIVTNGTNIPLQASGGNKDVKVVELDAKGWKPYSCDGKFLPMR